MQHLDILQRSIDCIEENLKAELSARELARQAGYSLYHFCRLFRAATGMGVKRYILRRRLLHAVCAIHGGKTGIQAALDYGFDTYPGFYRAFHREFHMPPKQFLDTYGPPGLYHPDLRKEQTMIITRNRAEALLAGWGMEGLPLSEVYGSSGRPKANTLYAGQDYVLKFSPNLGAIKNHIAVSKAIAAAGLQAALPIPAAQGEEYRSDGEIFACLTRRLPGRPLSAALLYSPEGPALARQMGNSLGRLHLALAGTELCVNDSNLFQAVTDWALPALREKLSLPEAFCRAYDTEFRALYPKLPRQVIHRDPNPGNILCSETGWAFLDFELSERNIRLYDPCYAATAILSENFGRANAHWLSLLRQILLGYGEIIPMTPEEKRAVPWVILSNQLICLAFFASDEKYAALFETNRSMTEFLLAHFSELSIP